MFLLLALFPFPFGFVAASAHESWRQHTVVGSFYIVSHNAGYRAFWGKTTLREGELLSEARSKLWPTMSAIVPYSMTPCNIERGGTTLWGSL